MGPANRAEAQLTEQRLAALELRYRRTLSDLNAARLSHVGARQELRTDEMEVRRALARVQHLQGQIADLQVAIELLEEGATA